MASRCSAEILSDDGEKIKISKKKKENHSIPGELQLMTTALLADGDDNFAKPNVLACLLSLPLCYFSCAVVLGRPNFFDI